LPAAFAAPPPVNYTTSDIDMATVEELIAEIGLSEAWLRRVLRTDEPYINRLVVLGIPRDEAERQSFRGDLRNVLELMRSHHFSARRGGEDPRPDTRGGIRFQFVGRGDEEEEDEQAEEVAEEAEEEAEEEVEEEENEDDEEEEEDKEEENEE
jgi:hypothetical protein